jgi:hypothetical protein
MGSSLDNTKEEGQGECEEVSDRKREDGMDQHRQ